MGTKKELIRIEILRKKSSKEFDINFSQEIPDSLKEVQKFLVEYIEQNIENFPIGKVISIEVYEPHDGGIAVKPNENLLSMSSDILHQLYAHAINLGMRMNQ